MANHALVGLIHSLIPNHHLAFQISSLVYPLRQVLASCNKVLLEIVLDVHSVDDTLRSEVLAREEHGEDSLTRQSGIVGGPDHLGELFRVVPCVLYQRCPGCVKLLRVQTASVYGPHRSA